MVKAFSTSERYVVRVKGYRIASVSKDGTFTFADPVTTNSVIPANNQTAQGNGSWTNLSSTHINYSSEFYNGTNYGDNMQTSYSDTDVNNYINIMTTEENAKTIYGVNGEGVAMLLPQQRNALSQTETKGSYIALLVQIDLVDGTPVYPALSNSSTEDSPKRICYLGLPKYYGYVIAPVTIDWQSGKKYTYVLDLSDAAGYVDPDKPDTVDPENPDTPNGKDDEDPYKPGDEVFGHAIKFTVTVEGWTDQPTGDPIKM